MMPGQISRCLKEWRRETDLRNYRADIIARCVLASTPGKRGRKIPKPFEMFGGRLEETRPRQLSSGKDGLRQMQAWAAEVNKAFR